MDYVLLVEHTYKLFEDIGQKNLRQIKLFWDSACKMWYISTHKHKEHIITIIIIKS